MEPKPNRPETLSDMITDNLGNKRRRTSSRVEIEELNKRNDEQSYDPKAKIVELVGQILESQSITNILTNEQREKINEETITYIRAYYTDPDDDIYDIAENATNDIYHYIKKAAQEKFDKSLVKDQIEMVQEEESELSLADILERIRCRCDERRLKCIEDEKSKSTRLKTRDGEEVDKDLEEYGIELESKQPCDVRIKKDIIDKKEMRKQLEKTFEMAEDKINEAEELITKSKLKKEKKIETEESLLADLKRREDKERRKITGSIESTSELSEKSEEKVFKDGDVKTTRTSHVREEERLRKKKEGIGFLDDEKIQMKDKGIFGKIEEKILDKGVMEVVKKKTSKIEIEKTGTTTTREDHRLAEDTIILTRFHDVETEEKTHYISEFDTYINKSASVSSGSSKSLILIKDETEEVDIEYVKRELYLKSDDAKRELQNLYRTKSEDTLKQFLSIKNFSKWYINNLLNDAEDYIEELFKAMDRIEEEEEPIYQEQEIEPVISQELFKRDYQTYDMTVPAPTTAEINDQIIVDECDDKMLLNQTTHILDEQEKVVETNLELKIGVDTKTSKLTTAEGNKKNEQELQTTVFARKNFDEAIVTQIHQTNERRHDMMNITQQIANIHLHKHVEENIIEKNETESVKEKHEDNVDVRLIESRFDTSKIPARTQQFNKDGYPIEVLLDKSPDDKIIKKLENIQHIVAQLDQVPSQTSEKNKTVTKVSQKVHTVTKITTHRTLSELHIHQTEEGEVLTATTKHNVLDIKLMLMPKKTEEANVFKDIENLRLNIGDFNVKYGYNLILEFISRWPLPDSWMFCTDYLREEADSTSNYYIYEVKFSKPTAQAPIPRITVSVYFTIEVSRIFPLKCPVYVTYVFEGTSTKYELDTVLKPEEFLNHILISKSTLFDQITF